MAKVNVKGQAVEEDRVAKALEQLDRQEKRRKAYSQKQKDDPEFKAKQRRNSQRRNARLQLLAAKAGQAGIKVTDEEIDRYLAKKAGK